MAYRLRDKDRIRDDPGINQFVGLLNNGDRDSGFMAVGVFNLLERLRIPVSLQDGRNPTVPGAIQDIRSMFQENALLENLTNPHYSRGQNMTCGAIETAKIVNVARKIGQSAQRYADFREFCAANANVFEIQDDDPPATRTLKQMLKIDFANIFYPSVFVRQQFGIMEDGNAQAQPIAANLNEAPLEDQLNAINNIDMVHHAHIGSNEMKQNLPICPTFHDFELMQLLMERRITFLTDTTNAINANMDEERNLWDNVTENFLLALKRSQDCGIYNILTMFSVQLKALVDAKEVGVRGRNINPNEDYFLQQFNQTPLGGVRLDQRIAAFNKLLTVLVLTSPPIVMGAIRNQENPTANFTMQMNTNTHCTFGEADAETLAGKLQQRYGINVTNQFPLSPKVYRRSAEIFRTITQHLPRVGDQSVLNVDGWHRVKLNEFGILKCNDWDAIRFSVSGAAMGDLVQRYLRRFRPAGQVPVRRESYLQQLMGQDERVDDPFPGFLEHVSTFLKAEVKMLIDVHGEIETLHNCMYLIQREPSFDPDYVHRPAVNPGLQCGNFASGILYAAAIGEQGQEFPNRLCFVLRDEHGHLVEDFNFFQFPNVTEYFTALHNHDHNTRENQFIRNIERVQEARNMLRKYEVKRLVIVFGSPWATCIERLVVNIIDLPNEPIWVIQHEDIIRLDDVPESNIFRHAMFYQRHINGLPLQVNNIHRMQIDWLSKCIVATLALHPWFQIEQDGATNIERFLLSSILATICFTTCPVSASLLLSSTIFEDDREVHLCDYLCDPPSNIYMDQVEMQLMRSVVNVFCGNRMTWGLQKLKDFPLMAPILSLLGNFNPEAIMEHMQRARTIMMQSLFQVPEPEIIVSDFKTDLPRPPRDGQDNQDGQNHLNNMAILLDFVANCTELQTDMKLLACNETELGGLTQGSLANIQVDLEYKSENNKREDRIQRMAPKIVKWMALVNMSHQQIMEILELMINSTDIVQLDNFFAIAREMPLLNRRMVCMFVLEEVKTASLNNFINFFNHNREWFEGHQFKLDKVRNQLQCNSSSFLPMTLTQEAGSSPYSKVNFQALKCYGKHALPRNKYEISAMWPFCRPFRFDYVEMLPRKIENNIGRVGNMTMRDVASTVVGHAMTLVQMRHRRLANNISSRLEPIQRRAVHSIVECVGGELLETVDNASNLNILDPLQPYERVANADRAIQLRQQVPYVCKIFRRHQEQQDASNYQNAHYRQFRHINARLTLAGTFSDVGSVWHLHASRYVQGEPEPNP